MTISDRPMLANCDLLHDRDCKLINIQLLTVAAVFAALALGCTSNDSSNNGALATEIEPRPTPHIDWSDFIRFGGTTYLPWHIDKDPPLQDEDLGPLFGRVEFKYDGIVTDPFYSPDNRKDGDAAYLEIGTPVYIVDGYKPEFILAARRNGKLSLYMSDSHPNAETGSDLLDLEGKVKYIGVNSPQDSKSELAAIIDQLQIDSLVSMILDAPVDLNIRNDPESDVYFLAFHLYDGITFSRGYVPPHNLMSGGIQLPVAFRIAIGDAIQLSE